MNENRTAIIIGAGPAGLTAAYELALKTSIKPIIFEELDSVGGISRTVDYKGNKIDIGGHRFFSKSKRVNDWWASILPLQGAPSLDELLLNINTNAKYKASLGGPNPEKTDTVMLIRERVSRILFLRRLFDYPISLNLQTLLNLGPLRVLRIILSYLKSCIYQIKPEQNLEEFFTNRFGGELYRTFFRDYTKKVWGVWPSEIKPEWGAQRIKGLSITKTLLHAFQQVIASLAKKKSTTAETETSLIAQFMYPKYGPGQLWEEVARKITALGGEIHLNSKVEQINTEANRVTSVQVCSPNETKEVSGDYFFSTMPIKDLVGGLASVPSPVREVSDNLQYRDFITVGVLVKKLKLRNQTKKTTHRNLVPDNWIYVQESDVNVGRLQIFNNWSPYLVKNLDHVWMGMEYFCNEGDELWSMDDNDFISFALDELAKIGVIDRADVLDAFMLRVKKTYPAYFGAYERFDEVKDYLSGYENLFLIGRNGMHRYNNMDHSMLTAMTAVENVINGVVDKTNIWSVNTEESYHEGK